MQWKIDQMKSSVLRVGDRESRYLGQIQQFELKKSGFSKN